MSLASHLLQRVFRLPPPRTRAVTVHRELAVPGADGVRLLADRWAPAEATAPLPTVLVRTPYGRANALGRIYGRALAERGFQVLLVSVRGTFGSQGRFEPQFHERADGLAVIDWIERQPWYDGRLVLAGMSYLGYTQWAVAADAPQVTAMIPQVTSSRLTLGFLRPYSLDGLLRWSVQTATQELPRPLLRALLGRRRLSRAFGALPLLEADLRALGRRWPFYEQTLRHEPDDPHWFEGDFTAGVACSRIPAAFVAGWYDVFLRDQLADYARLRDAGTPARLTVGPWVHSGIGALGAGLREVLDWGGAHARGEPPSDDAPVRVYVMGENRWRELDHWPPPGYRPRLYYLAPDGLRPNPPAGAAPSRYRYDPADPTPSVGGPLLAARTGAHDQRALESRPDVLTFTTDVLVADVEVIGEPTARVWLRSSRPCTDLFVRLCDVDACGRSRNVCDDLVTARPDGITPVDVALSPTAYRFRAGHRMRVQVSSGAFPRFARNPGSGEPIATAASLHVAEQEIFHDPTHPSTITLPVG